MDKSPTQDSSPVSDKQKVRLSIHFMSDCINIVDDARLRITNPSEYSPDDLELDLESVRLLCLAVRQNLESIQCHLPSI